MEVMTADLLEVFFDPSCCGDWTGSRAVTWRRCCGGALGGGRGGRDSIPIGDFLLLVESLLDGGNFVATASCVEHHLGDVFITGITVAEGLKRREVCRRGRHAIGCGDSEP